MSQFANTPEPPYYAVIFTSIKSHEDNEYEKMSKEILEILKNQEGFLGFESAREEIGITVSYWKNLDSIKKWRNNPLHKQAQKLGKNLWYERYKVRIAKVEKEYEFIK